MDDPTAPGLLDAAWRYRGMIAICGVIGLLVAGILGAIFVPKASADATVALTTPTSRSVIAPGVQGDASLTRYTSQRALFATNDDVNDDAVTSLEGWTASKLGNAVTVTPSSNNTSFVVRVDAATPQQAVDAVNAIVDSYRAASLTQVRTATDATLAPITANIDAIQKQLEGGADGQTKLALAQTLTSLQQQKSAIESDSALFGDGVDFVQAASLANAAGQRIPFTQLALGLMLGVLLGMGLAWWRADNNRRVDRPGQAAELLDTELIGEISDLGRPVTTESDRAQRYQRTREILAPVFDRIVPGSILVTSGTAGAGASVAATGVAAAAAAEGLRVALIDGDLMTGGLSAHLGLPEDGSGLAEAAGTSSSDVSTHFHVVEISPGIRVAALGYGSASRGLTDLNAASLRAFMARVRVAFDVVVVDAPAARHDYVASVLSGSVDHVLVVVARGTPTADLENLHQLLTASRATVAGYIYTFGKPARQRS